MPELNAALTRGGAQADAKVADRLYFRALGYKHKAEKIFHNPDTGVVRAPYVEQYAPDTNAALAWLSRRQPELWKDRQEVNVTGSLEHRLSQMTPEERGRYALDLAERVRARVAELRTIEGIRAREVIDGKAEEFEVERTRRRTRWCSASTKNRRSRRSTAPSRVWP